MSNARATVDTEIAEQVAAFAPLHHPVFRAIWMASVASNLGTWIQNVGAAWLMTELSPSPLMVALIQAATTLPVFLIGIPAGALADIVDRRRLLLFAQFWMLISTGLLAAFSIMNWMSPAALLAFTFAIGLGFALNSPAWQAIIPELVPRRELQSAIELNGAALNGSRALGPAIGGIVVAAFGPSATFVLNATSFLGVIVVLYFWKRPIVRSLLPAERLFGASKAGLRYVRHAPEVRSVLFRTGVFVSGAAGLWALLPVIIRADLDRGPSAYGILLGCLGMGAVVATLTLPLARRFLKADTIVVFSTLAFSMGTAVTATLPYYGVWCVALVFAGAGWLTVLTHLSGAVQVLVPEWVRARVIAVYLLVFYGGLAIGSIAWGFAANKIGSESALAVSASWTAIGLLAAIGYRLPEDPSLDTTATHHWPEAPLVSDYDSSTGPVMVLVKYQVFPENSTKFFDLIGKLREGRLRTGAIRWDLFRDAAESGIFAESFIVESWAEHLRQHHRVTAADKQLETQIRGLCVDRKPPSVTHFLAATPPNKTLA